MAITVIHREDNDTQAVDARAAQQGLRLPRNSCLRDRWDSHRSTCATILARSIGIAILCSATAGAAGMSGEQLHRQQCLGCHGTEVYQRQDRFVDSKEALYEQVARCARGAAKLDWEQARIDRVARYLNEAYYGF